MNDLPRDKYEFLDIVFTFFHTLCMSLTAIFLLSNLIVSLMLAVVIVLFAFVVVFLWKSRNPFSYYLVTTLALNNLLVTLVALVIFYATVPSSPTLPFYNAYTLLLLPSGIYLVIAYLVSPDYVSLRIAHKRTGLMLAFVGRTKAARRLLIGDDVEKKRKLDEFVTKNKKEYRYKAIISLCIAFTLCSFAALIFGFS